MIKYYCDRCGKEVPSTDLIDLVVRAHKESSTDNPCRMLVSVVPGASYQVCEACSSLIYNFIKNEKIQIAD